jgi:predicted pyridoxine 5'-phosphate oxidase superfamily flavin-nucleotide-binding protein
MNKNFTKLAFTPTVKTIQENMGSRRNYERMEASGDRYILTDQERSFIESRVDFFISTVGENGWPYMQHRGGPKGFLKVLSEDTLGFADFKGNRQYISSGNISANGKAMLFLIDYPTKQRVKIWVEAQYIPKEEAGEYLGQFVPEGMEDNVVSVFILKIQAYDWNCPKYITQRFTA